MILIIDTNTKRFALTTEGEDLSWFYVIQDEPENQKDWIAVLKSLLFEKKTSLSRLKKVVVIQGKGGFSDTRSGVVIANTLAFAKETAIVSVSQEEFDNGEWVKKSASNNQIAPEYYAPANIS